MNLWKKKILLVEDEEIIAEAVQARLEIEGYKVKIAPNGQSAIELIRKENPNIILLDIMLPKIDGIEILKIIKRDPKFKDIPVIMLTGLNQVKDSEKAFDLGVCDYVTKPFEYDRLIEKIRKFIRP